MRYVIKEAVVPIITLMLPALTIAQGQDSSTWVRDQQVIATMLTGVYSNANQAYFDKRGKIKNPHARRGISITSDKSVNHFLVKTVASNDQKKEITQAWQLFADNSRGMVGMRVILDSDNSACPLFWKREAAQFRATISEDCSQEENAPVSLTLSKQQLWWETTAKTANNFKFHRARSFTCYADIPGVGGGRDVPYRRYDGLSLHDQGDEAWFNTKENRTLGVRLFLVDWPINNYTGYFTRDSLVIYIMERMSTGVIKEHGYAFTVPEANRVGINLKWMLASCFMVSGQEDTPSM